MPDVTIRQATLADLDQLLRWREEVLRCVFSLSTDTDTTVLRQANEAYYRCQLPTEGHIACFAYTDGGAEPIGCGGLCLHEEMPSPDNPTGHCAYLMNIYVRPSCRGQHVGRHIVRWLVGQALSRGITKIYLETSEPGRRLYKSLGFGNMKDMMCLSFEENL